MHLIVAEKNISARRIATILAGRQKVTETRDAGIARYQYDDCIAIGLKGHVVEIDFVEGYSNWRSKENTPRSLIDAKTVKVPTEKRIVQLLQKLARRSGRITIATDFDTEGELIGKEAYELIREVNPAVPIDRARFSAITPDEIKHAFDHTTALDFHLAAAGEARQVIDLVWGASLTRFLSLAARRGGSNILSVGRVQSPTLAMIVDREKEIREFKPETYWQLSLLTEKSGEEIEVRHSTARFTDRDEALAARDHTTAPLIVTSVKEGTKTDRAPPPFDTTTFIVAASRLGFSAAHAMRIAEDLYMNGFISYPRTDNTVYPASLDLGGVLAAIHPTSFSKDVEWVIDNRRSSPTRGKKTSTDHPPIHPASAARKEVLGEEAWKIYELVVRRFLATLSPDAQWRTMKVNFNAGDEPYTATGGALTDPGWHRVYPYSTTTEYIMPVMTVGERLPIKKVTLEEKQTQPPPRYTQSRLIQQMEELGLGTKSTRHEVIQKLLSRKYIEGNPLRPTLVGSAVIESLEHHADTITRPGMTQTLEAHMQQIKEQKRARDDVVRESREMLHHIFDEMEPHAREIGDEIMDQTAEELTLGPCPVCGHDIRIRHLRNQTQFIGCTNYPDCGFNISLPSALWGFAVRTDATCGVHLLHHIRLIKKGSRPWEIGCPLCHHIANNREAFGLVPSLTKDLQDALIRAHIYTVYDLVQVPPSNLAASLGITEERARAIGHEAENALDLLRRRSDCKKFVRKILPPRKGRSHSQIIKKLHESGINDIFGLGSADQELLRNAGIGEKEADQLINEARRLSYDRFLRKAGIPAASLKRYHDAGITCPDEFLNSHPVFLAEKTGISLATVYRHVQMVGDEMGRPVPAKVSKAQAEKGRSELRSLPGMDDSTLLVLAKAGIINGQTFRSHDPAWIAGHSGLPVEKTRQYQKILSDRAKKAEKDIIIV